MAKRKSQIEKQTPNKKDKLEQKIFNHIIEQVNVKSGYNHTKQ